MTPAELHCILKMAQAMTRTSWGNGNRPHHKRMLTMAATAFRALQHTSEGVAVIDRFNHLDLPGVYS